MSSAPVETDKKQPELKAPSTGFGKITLTELSQRYGVDLEVTLSKLQQKNSEISGEMKLKEIGELLGESPRDLFEQLSGLETGSG
ncbi:hypothetical protein L3Q72_19655 [Vibrio sp. JC009]|uniref:hypothetical protein n=1 Tax=Vibrio sp. JC009 TaxID=2912314 RepID=UPI0023B17FD1|nr:hypothetical protein [Vibrio sp. JC009]WED23458.1 hypothetical protein L3Q72_19655 [Vibrio sp. JC009]